MGIIYSKCQRLLICVSRYFTIRLGLYFGVSDKYFLNIQNDIDCRRQKIIMKDELERISGVGAKPA